MSRAVRILIGAFVALAGIALLFTGMFVLMAIGLIILSIGVAVAWQGEGGLSFYWVFCDSCGSKRGA